jgi:hypothetical protein
MFLQVFFAPKKVIDLIKCGHTGSILLTSPQPRKDSQ